MDWEDTAWLPVLEKKGIHQTAWILENYGIDCETDVSLLDRDDFSKLASNGLKPIEWAQVHGRKEWSQVHGRKETRALV